MDPGRYTVAETGLIYLRARYYDPTTGQFLTRDPLVALTGSAYGYVDGNPLNDVDPTGLCPWGMGEVCHVVKHDVLPAAHDVADWATSPTNLPNSRVFTGYLNVLYGGWSLAQGATLVVVGSGADVTGIGAVLRSASSGMRCVQARGWRSSRVPRFDAAHRRLLLPPDGVQVATALWRRHWTSARWRRHRIPAGRPSVSQESRDQRRLPFAPALLLMLLRGVCFG